MQSSRVWTGFLGKLPVNGPKSIPLIENAGEHGVEFLINRKILGSCYRRLIKNWLPGGDVWKDRIYYCYPFEIVLKDFVLTEQETVDLLNGACPTLLQGRLFAGAFWGRGRWTITSNVTDIFNFNDQIDLHRAILGVPRRHSVRVLKKEFNLENQTGLLDDSPCGAQQIKAVYEPIYTSKILQAVGEYENEYLVLNPNGSVRGVVAKVGVGTSSYLAPATPWRMNQRPFECNWLPYGFEKPYPFFCSELLEQHTDASVFLTEDIDVAQAFYKDALDGKPKDIICLSWVGGRSAVNGLDWSLLAGRKVGYLFSDNDEGRKTALAVREQASNNKVLIDSYICYRKQTARERHQRSVKSLRHGSFGRPQLYHVISVKEFENKIASCLNERDKKVEDEQKGIFAGELLKKDIPQKEFLIEPFIKADEFLIIAAPKKTFKSFVSLDIAMALACGSGIGGRLRAPKPQPVTIVDAEMWIGTIQERSKNMRGLYHGADLKKRIDDNLYWVSLNELSKRINLMLEEDRSWIESKMLTGTRLLVLDNLGKLVPPESETNQRVWRVIEGWIRKLNARGIAVVLVTHMTKNGHHVRGSGKIMDDADTIVTLKKPKDSGRGDKVEVHFEGSRGLYGDATAPFSLCYTEQNRRFVRYVQNLDEQLDGVRLVSSSEIKKHALKGLKLEMVELAREQGEVRAGNFKQEKGGPSDSQISTLLKALCDEGLLVREGERSKSRYYPNESMLKE